MVLGNINEMCIGLVVLLNAPVDYFSVMSGCAQWHNLVSVGFEHTTSQYQKSEPQHSSTSKSSKKVLKL